MALRSIDGSSRPGSLALLTMLLALGQAPAAAAAELGVVPSSSHLRAGSVVPEAPAVPATPAAQPIRAVVLLVVLTDPRPGAPVFSPALVDAIEAELRRVYQVEVRRLDPRVLPRSAFTAPRRRYRADRLLEVLGEQIPAGAPARTRVLGLTTADISTTKDGFKDWGIFGLGALNGTAAVVSSHRLRRKARDAAQLQWRVTNTAVHELGHVLGLDHCEEPRCVMLDAQGGITNTDESTGEPGPGCRAKLDRITPLQTPIEPAP